MLHRIRSHRPTQLVLGLLFGICFGFLLQKGGVTRYEIIMGQLLLVDWTVVQVMLTAVVTGMLGIQIMLSLGLVQMHKKPGSVGRTVIGGLIFGVGFGVLGYCPGTGMGAAGQGSIDALIGGVGGMILGAASFAAIYPKVKGGVLKIGGLGEVTLNEALRAPRWPTVLGSAIGLSGLLLLIEQWGG
jgi:hypothetical protein